MIEKALQWIPRTLAAFYGAFLALFAFDVFGTGAGLWRAVLGFLIHLFPVYLVAGALAVAWRWEKAGGTLFIFLALAYFVLTKGTMAPTTYILIAGPPLVIGLLFIWSGLIRRRGGAHRNAAGPVVRP